MQVSLFKISQKQLLKIFFFLFIFSIFFILSLKIIWFIVILIFLVFILFLLLYLIIFHLSSLATLHKIKKDIKNDHLFYHTIFPIKTYYLKNNYYNLQNNNSYIFEIKQYYLKKIAILKTLNYLFFFLIGITVVIVLFFSVISNVIVKYNNLFYELLALTLSLILIPTLKHIYKKYIKRHNGKVKKEVNNELTKIINFKILLNCYDEIVTMCNINKIPNYFHYNNKSKYFYNEQQLWKAYLKYLYIFNQLFWIFFLNFKLKDFNNKSKNKKWILWQQLKNKIEFFYNNLELDFYENKKYFETNLNNNYNHLISFIDENIKNLFKWKYYRDLFEILNLNITKELDFSDYEKLIDKCKFNDFYLTYINFIFNYKC